MIEPSARLLSSGLPLEDAERRDAFVRLLETYADAHKLVPGDGPHADLQWILGTRRDATQNPPSLETRTVEVVALWLQDLASEMDRRLPAHGDAARNLRDATAKFLLAFRGDRP